MIEKVHVVHIGVHVVSDRMGCKCMKTNIECTLCTL